MRTNRKSIWHMAFLKDLITSFLDILELPQTRGLVAFPSRILWFTVSWPLLETVCTLLFLRAREDHPFVCHLLCAPEQLWETWTPCDGLWWLSSIGSVLRAPGHVDIPTRCVFETHSVLPCSVSLLWPPIISLPILSSWKGLKVGDTVEESEKESEKKRKTEEWN